MPKLADRLICSGCTACLASCPTGAIVMRPDVEGFLYPHVDGQRCVNCNRCESVCPALGIKEKSLPIECFAATTLDQSLLMASSSGGIFTELAKPFLEVGGCVFGCVFERGSWDVVHAKAEILSELSAMRGSKYVQSDMRDTLKEVKRECLSGREVLFSGTPCEIAGLKAYLGRDYPNLLTVGLICHGTPSGYFFKRRLASLRCGEGDVTGVTFRSKRLGWERFCFEVSYQSGRDFYETQQKGVYMRLFNGDVAHRLSCYDCKARGGRSGADILIGDFWGVEKFHQDMYDARGVSAVLVYTQRGLEAYNRLQVKSKRVAFEEIAYANKNIQGDVVMTWRRRWCYRLLRVFPMDWVAEFFAMSCVNYWKRLLYPMYRPVKQIFKRI